MTSNYEKLHALSQEAAVLHSIGALLEWDQETYMPSKGIDLRSAQLEVTATAAHKAKVAPRFVRALEKLIDLQTGTILDSSLSEAHRAALLRWRHDLLKAQRLPLSFVKKFAKATSEAIHTWSQAKRAKNFKAFAPHLEKIVSLCRKKADYLGYSDHPYDALLDDYEPDMTVQQINPLFERLRSSLVSLLNRLKNSKEDESFLHLEYAEREQWEFGNLLLEAMGFDKSMSRLDQTSHPFCAAFHPFDIRLTTRVHPKQFLSSIFSVIHEGGHGLYTMGLPVKEWGSPLAESISLGIDESQSRFWETRIGKSLPFWRYFYPILQKKFQSQLAAVSLEQFYHAINQVKRSLIRIEADEVTYSLHVIVRYEIEKKLIEGSLKVKEIPEYWNQKMQEYVGVTPGDDGEGCLQDIHWSMGGFGYFPTYTLGNLYAAQLFDAFAKAHIDWQERLAKGDLGFIRQWLHTNVHRFGRQYSQNELMMKVTGGQLSEKPFISYLEKKFL